LTTLGAFVGYFSSEEVDVNNSYSMNLTIDNGYLQNDSSKRIGFPLRCVKI
jgi:hypothetical protein